ncbi:hypothetical protein NSTC745_04795 [Nostoc sp. DSM 114161]|jgi:hypothetical protein
MRVYHEQESYDIYDDNLSLDAFKQAFKLMVEKHPIFRTVDQDLQHRD